VERLICFAIGYAFGLFPSGDIIGKLNGVDLRQVGSKNIGTTNTLRNLGPFMALIVLLLDAFKCIIPVIITRIVYIDSHYDMILLLALYASAGAIIGHNFPFYNGFKGGKGIACTAGSIVSFGLIPTIILLIGFFSIFIITHYVSLGSMCIYLVFFIVVLIFGQNGTLSAIEGYLHVAPQYLIEVYIIILAMFIVAAIRHKENIQRLIKHEERKTYIFKKNKKD